MEDLNHNKILSLYIYCEYIRFICKLQKLMNSKYPVQSQSRIITGRVLTESRKIICYECNVIRKYNCVSVCVRSSRNICIMTWVD